MQLNVNAVNRVVETIREDALSSSSPYNYDSILDSLKLRSDKDKTRADGIMICCPFHNETDPSLSISYERQSWYCFGCGRKGDHVQFLTEYDKCVLGMDVSRITKINQILRSDARIRAKAGVDSIYMKSSTVSEFTPIVKKKFTYVQPEAKTYLEVATRMCKENFTDEQKQFAILLMQSGIAPSQIIDEVKGARPVVKQEFNYDIEDLWEE